MGLSKEEITNRIKLKCSLKNYTFVGFDNYDSIKSRLIIKCNKDGYEWKTNYTGFVYYNQGCSRCAGNAPYTKDEIISKVLDKCKDKNYSLGEVFSFKGNKTEFILKCNKDDHQWKSNYHYFINQNLCCQRCYGNIPLTKEEYLKNINDRCLKRNYTFIDIDYWIGNKTKLILKCNIDNYKWSIRYDSFITNNIGCPKCGSKTKYAEPFERKLKSLNILFIKEKTFIGLRQKYPLRFDYFLPKENILIELDGNEHANSNNNAFITDKIKEKFCIKNNIKLIRIKNKDVETIDITKILMKNIKN